MMQTGASGETLYVNIERSKTQESDARPAVPSYKLATDWRVPFGPGSRRVAPGAARHLHHCIQHIRARLRPFG
jgi:hypothetical protein